MSRNLLLVSGFLLVASWGLVAAAMGICLYHDYDKSSFWVDYFGPKWIIVGNVSYSSFLGNTTITTSSGSNNTTIAKCRSGATMSSNVAMINGKKYNLPSGSSISIVGETIYVDGKVWTENEKEDQNLKKDLQIAQKIELYVTMKEAGSLDTHAGSVVVHGNAKSFESTSGSIRINGDVSGNVDSTSGSVTVEKNVGGNVETVSGSVRASSILGKVSTVSGSIR